MQRRRAAPAVAVAGAWGAVPRVADGPRALAKSCPGLAARRAESWRGAL